MKPQKLKFKVLSTAWLNKKVLDLRFEMVEPQNLEFIPGQHLSIIVAPGISRPYCIHTSPRDTKTFGIEVSAAHEGVGSNYLKNLKIGDIVEAMGPLGRKQIAQVHKDNIVFATVGTGVSPAISILTEMQFQNVKSKIRLFFGLRSQNDLFNKEKLDALKESLANFDYEIVYSRPDPGWAGLTGYVNDYVEINDIGNTQYYIIGWSQMVDDLKLKLLTAGVPQENIIS